MRGKGRFSLFGRLRDMSMGYTLRVGADEAGAAEDHARGHGAGGLPVICDPARSGGHLGRSWGSRLVRSDRGSDQARQIGVAGWAWMDAVSIEVLRQARRFKHVQYPDLLTCSCTCRANS